MATNKYLGQDALEELIIKTKSYVQNYFNENKGIEEISDTSINIYSLTANVYRLTANDVTLYCDPNTTVTTVNGSLLAVGNAITVGGINYIPAVLIDIDSQPGQYFILSNSTANSSIIRRTLLDSDIINNLTSTDTDKPLSAAQGKVLKDSVDGKVTKTSSANQVYGTAAADTETTLTYGTSATASYIVQRDNNGQVFVPETQTADGQAASKKYVDTQDATKVDKTSSANKIYATDNSSTPAQTTLTYGTAATANYIVQRTSGGQITVPTTPSADTDAASKAFVNSSIATNTATFLGSYNLVDDLKFTTITWDSVTGALTTPTTAQIIAALDNKISGETNNDYCFVLIPTTVQSSGTIKRVDRYKYSGSAWEFEYTLNNSSFTEAQWAAINSGIDSTKVSTYDGYATSKQNTITGAATSITSSDLTANKVLVSNASGKVAASSISTTELGYLDNVTSDIQAQINSKQATITGGATTIVSNNLTANRALVSDASGKVAISDVTSTELGYLDGVTSAIQTQLNNKADSSSLNSYVPTTRKVNNKALSADITINVSDLGSTGANTAYNKNFETTASNIQMNGTAAVGTLTTVARADHVHPTDTSRLAVSAFLTASDVDALWDATEPSTT